MPEAYVVKAFNTVFAANQSTGRVGDQKLTLFVAGDNVKAKQTVMQLGREICFDSVDAGELMVGGYLETMAMLIMNLAFDIGMGTNIGYKLVKS